MKPDVPVLRLSLRIPLSESTTADQVLNQISLAVRKALRRFRARQAAAAWDLAVRKLDDGPDPTNGTLPPESAPNHLISAVVHEKNETHSAENRDDLLAKLGYTVWA